MRLSETLPAYGIGMQAYDDNYAYGDGYRVSADRRHGTGRQQPSDASADNGRDACEENRSRFMYKHTILQPLSARREHGRARTHMLTG